MRIVPGQGRIIWPENDINLKQTMAMGCWSEQELVGEQGHWQAKKLTTDASEWEVLLDGEKVGEVKWSTSCSRAATYTARCVSSVWNMPVRYCRCGTAGRGPRPVGVDAPG